MESNNNKIKHEPYIHPERLEKHGLHNFFDKTFSCFSQELNILRNTIYNYKNEGDIFALNERAWVGVFNNAVIKAFPDSSATLQEFSVYNDDKEFSGRADFLVHWKDEKGKEFHLLFEAKQYEERSLNNLYEDSAIDMEEIKKQGKRYVDSESVYYKDKTVYVIPLVFGWIRKTKVLEQAVGYFKDSVNKIDSPTDFCSLFYEGNHGVWVYGYINKAEII